MVYFLDYTLGCAWWVMVLYLVQLFAVLVVRGKPYGAEQVGWLVGNVKEETFICVEFHAGKIDKYLSSQGFTTVDLW